MKKGFMAPSLPEFLLQSPPPTTPKQGRFCEVFFPDAILSCLLFSRLSLALPDLSTGYCPVPSLNIAPYDYGIATLRKLVLLFCRVT